MALHSSLDAKCGLENVTVMRQLLKDKPIIKRLSKTILIWQNGGWEHSDSEWFIRINDFSACILFAPDLDFTVPGIHTKRTLYDDFTKKRICAESKEFRRYTFLRKGPSQITAQLDRADRFLAWIANHGDRTVFRESPE